MNKKLDSNDFLASAVEQSSEGMAIADLEGKLIYVNPAWIKMHQYESAEQLIGNSLKFFHNDEQMENEVVPFIKIVKEKGTNTGEVGHIRRDGTPFPTLMTTSLIKDDNGRAIAILGVAKDISERKNFEIKLAEEKSKYKAMMAALGDGLTVQDRNFRIIFQNDIHKERQGDHLGEFCYKAYQMRDNICPECLVERTFSDGMLHRRETAAVKDGQVIHMEVSASPVFDAKGEVVSVVEVVRDLTFQKNIVKEKLNLEKQLHQSSKMDAIGTLAGGIAHDFNNLLTIIVGYSEIIRENSSDESNVQESIKQVQIAADRATHLVQQILAFSRQAAHELIPVKLQCIVKEMLKLLRSSIPTTIEIIQDVQPQCSVVKADPTQINQILMNLCANAMHAMDEKGVLQVTLQNVNLDAEALKLQPKMGPGCFVQLSVSDTGVGMDQETINHIFEPFYTTKEVGKGTGMGLAVIHGIVESHGGFIVLDSELGRGSTFHVFFPVTEEEEFLGVETSGKPATGTEQILLVDDEEDILKMVKRILKNLGYKVMIQNSSVKALEIFKSNPDHFDLIITDQTMPDLSGSELATELLKVRPRMPIILCSGYSSKVSGDNARGKGISKYLDKPYDKKILAAAVREVLNGKV